jgi:hypothetical protein
MNQLSLLIHVAVGLEPRLETIDRLPPEALALGEPADSSRGLLRGLCRRSRLIDRRRRRFGRLATTEDSKGKTDHQEALHGVLLLAVRR